MTQPNSPNSNDPVEAREQQVLDQIADLDVNSPLTVNRREVEGMTVLALSGELDVATAPDLDGRISEVLEGGEGPLVLDLSQLSFLDSKGLACFLRASARQPGRIAIASPRERITRLFQATGLAERLQVRSSLAEALAAVRSWSGS